MQIYISEFIDNRFSLKVEYNPEVIIKLKQIGGFYWHSDHKFWSFPATQENLDRVLDIAYLHSPRDKKAAEEIIEEDSESLTHCDLKLFHDELKLLKYSRSTIKNYLSCLKEFLTIQSDESEAFKKGLNSSFYIKSVTAYQLQV